MTLAAAILLLGSSPLLIPGLMPQSRGTSPSQSGSAATQEQPPQNSTQPATSKSPEARPSDSASAKKTKRTTKSARRKKQVAPANCDPAPPTSTNPGTTSTAKADTQSAGVSEAPKNCPPAKIVVQKGGITEQSIQLAGGSANDVRQKRDTANRMLAATEDNLKKISGWQLSTEQQDSATQIRQFVNQSKSAMAAGDLERAQTLAWKAKLLSDDLVNPGK